MSRPALVALTAFVVAAVGLVGWLLLADGPQPGVAAQEVMEKQDEAASALEDEPVDRDTVPGRLEEREAPAVAVAGRPERLPQLEEQSPGEGQPRQVLEGLESEGNIDADDRMAVARFALPLVSACLRDEANGEALVVAQVHVLNNGGARAALDKARVVEGPGDLRRLQTCVERAINGKSLEVGAPAIDAVVSLPVRARVNPR